MSDWAAVVLTLGLSALAVVVYAVRSMVAARAAAVVVKDMQGRLVALEVTIGDRSARINRLEQALKLDGQRIMAEANRAALPALMR